MQKLVQSNVALAQDEFSSAEIKPGGPNASRPLEIALGKGKVTYGGKEESFTSELKKIAEGVASFVTEGCSETAQLIAGIGTAAIQLLKNPTTAVAAAGIGLGAAATPKASAALMPDGSTESAYQNFGLQYQGSTLFFEGQTPGGQTYHASAIFLDPWNVLTSAHLLSGGTPIGVGNGTSFLSDRGSVAGILNYVIYPGWDGSLNTPDLAILHLSQPLQGQATTIGSISIGDTLNFAGFGLPARPSDGVLPDSGSLYGWQAPVESSITPANVSMQYYYDARFYPGAGPLNGRATSGESGGGVYNAAGQLVGMTEASWGGLGQIGGTDVLRLNENGLPLWIQQNMQVVPEPGTMTLIGLGVGTLLLFNRKRR